MRTLLNVVFTLSILLSTYLYPHELTHSQSGPEMTQGQFKEQLEKAVADSNFARVETMVQQNRRQALGLFTPLLDSFIRFQVQGKIDSARQHLAKARILAQAYQKVYGDFYLTRQVKLFAGWNRQQKWQKIKGDSLRNIGRELYFSGRLNHARPFFEQALPIYQSIGDSTGEALMLNNIGALLRILGNLDRAEDYFHHSLKIAKQIQFTRGIYINISSLGGLYREKGQFRLAQEYHRQDYDMALKIGSKRDLEGSLGNLGLSAMDLGDYEQAASYLHQALTLAQEITDGHGERLAQLNLGALYADLGDYEKSKYHQELAYKMAKKADDLHGQALSLTNLGTVFEYLGDHERALSSLDSSSVLYRQLGDEYGVEANLVNSATIYSGLKQFDQAVAAGRQAAKLAQSIGNKHLEAYAYLSLGRVYEKMENINEALYYFENALRLARETENYENIAKSYWFIGQIKEKQAQFEEASKQYRLALDIIESLWIKLRSESFKVTFLENKIGIYYDLISMLVKLERYQEAFYFTERARARALYEMLAMARAGIRGGIDSTLLLRKQEVEYHLTHILEQIQEQHSQKPVKPGSSRLDSLLKQQQQYRLRHEEILHEIEQHYPQYAEVTGISEPLTLAEIQLKVLSDKTVLLEYLLAEDQLIIWVVGKTFFNYELVPVPRDSLTQLVQQLLQPFKRLHEKQDANLADLTFDLKLAQCLHQILIQPVASHLPDSVQLIIVPDRILHYLPFEALVTSVDKKPHDAKVIFSRYERAHYLIEKHPISYAHSASVLNPELRHRSPGKPTVLTLLGMGNPDFGKFSSRQLAVEEEPVNLTLADFIFRATNGQAFVPLPGSRQEIEDIQRILHPAQVYFDRSATEDAFKATAGKCQFVHLATHAITETKQPLYSRVIFALDDDPAEDGFLHAWEVFDLYLNAELVTLSACETGLGELSQGEGLLGLSRAFLYAGARSVMVSLWSVEESTSKLMDLFYKNLRQGNNKAEALQKAKISLLRQRARFSQGTEFSFAMPFLWSPFIVIGDTRPVAIADRSGIGWLIMMSIAIFIVLILLGYHFRRRLGRMISSCFFLKFLASILGFKRQHT